MKVPGSAGCTGRGCNLLVDTPLTTGALQGMNRAGVPVRNLLVGIVIQTWGGNTWPTILAVFSGMVIYAVVLVAVGGIRSEDVHRLPVIGAWAAALLIRLGR